MVLLPLEHQRADGLPRPYPIRNEPPLRRGPSALPSLAQRGSANLANCSEPASSTLARATGMTSCRVPEGARNLHHPPAKPRRLLVELIDPDDALCSSHRLGGPGTHLLIPASGRLHHSGRLCAGHCLPGWRRCLWTSHWNEGASQTHPRPAPGITSPTRNELSVWQDDYTLGHPPALPRCRLSSWGSPTLRQYSSAVTAICLINSEFSTSRLRWRGFHRQEGLSSSRSSEV